MSLDKKVREGGRTGARLELETITGFSFAGDRWPGAITGYAAGARPDIARCRAACVRRKAAGQGTNGGGKEHRTIAVVCPPGEIPRQQKYFLGGAAVLRQTSCGLTMRAACRMRVRIVFMHARECLVCAHAPGCLLGRSNSQVSRQPLQQVDPNPCRLAAAWQPSCHGCAQASSV